MGVVTARGGTWSNDTVAGAVARISTLDARFEARVVVSGTVALAAICILLLLVPGRTYSGQYTHDVMIYLDGAHRVLDGQMPNRDFHTPLGLLAYLLPASGLWLTGTAGGMMPAATAVFLLILCPAVAYVSASRLSLSYAVLFSTLELGIAAMPAPVGEAVPSFAMFYNRWGYVLLGLLFLLALPGRSGRAHRAADAAVAAFVLLATFYLKVSYFAVGAVFTAALLPDRGTRRLAATALLITAGGIALVHLAWGGTAVYIDDLRTAAAASGVVRGTLGLLFHVAILNLDTIVPFALVLGISRLSGAPWGVTLLCLFMAGSGLAIANQNTQAAGILTLIPAAIVASMSFRGRAIAASWAAPTVLALVASLALPPAISAADILVRHAVNASRGGSSAQQYVANIDRFYVQEVAIPVAGSPGLETSRSVYRDGSADLQSLAIIRSLSTRQVLAQPEYVWTLQDGIGLLRDRPDLGGSILVLDMANPMNALLGRHAPRGIESWYHNGRTFSETTYRSADSVFRDVDVVMLPRAPVSPPAHNLLMRLYGDRLQRDYDLVATSDYWRAYARKVRRADTGGSKQG